MVRSAANRQGNVRQLSGNFIVSGEWSPWFFYKMINNLVDVDVSAFFTLSDCELTRSNGRELKKSHCCSTRDSNFFLLSCH